ncbi:ParB/RepB/Spo0J family partition protein [Streptomyces smyrnaeus]|uniref:ParB/RepB/Spo0J family partition protein n=1 Tax=Streptomyces smyrnaeus TaxID=1387713 RepID=UPI0036AC08EA
MSRVADQLGTGSSFGRTRGGVSARRQAVAATTGAPTTGAPDSRLRTLPLTQLVPTRFNPRRNFGSDDELREFGQRLKAKQLQPAVAVNREAYLELWPGETDAVGEAAYVIANGERRYRASLAVGLPTLEVVVDDEVAHSRGDFLHAILSENNDREDLDPIERALGLRTMVDELGGKAKVAEYYGKSAGWVTQQMYLLNLTPRLQELVSSGDLPVRETRALVKLPADEQLAAWEARSAKRDEEKAQPKPRRGKHRSGAAGTAGDGAQETRSFTAVKETPVDEPAPDSDSFTAVKNDRASHDPELPLPDQRPGTTENQRPGTTENQRPTSAQTQEEVPWDDPGALCDLLTRRMTRQDRIALTKLLINANTADAAAIDTL